MTTNRTYGYCYFRQYLIRSDQSLFRAVRILLFGYHRYRIRSLGISLAEVVIGLMILLRQRLYPSARPAVKLSIAGDIAIRVHRGHKVFDLAAATVTKVFAKDIAGEEAARQINASRQASVVAAAPRFIAADKGLCWYTEEYVRGRHGTNTEAAREGRYMEFYPAAEACLLDLIGSSGDKTVDLVAYVDELTDPLSMKLWDVDSASQACAHEIRSFQAEIRSWLLDNLPSPELELVLIHGDFSLVNVIVDGNFRVIDWEGIRYGSMFGDIFNFVFVEKYYERAQSDVTAEIDEVRLRFAEGVAQRFPKLASAASVPKTFAVRLYYLERLKVMLERQMTANLIGVIRKSMHMFREFDSAARFPKFEEC